MATYILKWNPAISSYKMMDFLFEMNIAISGSTPNMNWSVWEYEKIRKGDIVYLLKVGYGATGIVLKGKVTSEAYSADDWSGKGRETYYVDFIPLCMVSPDAAVVLTSQRLEENIGDFDWRGGHSGMRLTPEQETVINSLWDDYVKETFGTKPKSNPPAVFFKPRKKNTQENTDTELTNLGIMLYNAIELRRRHLWNYKYIDSDKLNQTIRWLLKDAKDTLAYALSNLECANSTEWKNPEYLTYLRNAVDTFRNLKQQGQTININLDKLDTRLAERERFAEYMSDVEEKAEIGELTENLRDLIDGFDEINKRIGSFYDSELLCFNVDHEKNYVELRLHIRNEVNNMVTLRFEGDIEYEVCGDGYGDCICIYWGYFYRYDDRICLYLRGFGEISANRLRVISIVPIPDED